MSHNILANADRILSILLASVFSNLFCFASRSSAVIQLLALTSVLLPVLPVLLPELLRLSFLEELLHLRCVTLRPAETSHTQPLVFHTSGIRWHVVQEVLIQQLCAWRSPPGMARPLKIDAGSVNALGMSINALACGSHSLRCRYLFSYECYTERDQQGPHIEKYSEADNPFDFSLEQNGIARFCRCHGLAVSPH